MFGGITCGETHLYHEEGTDNSFYLRMDIDPALLLLAPLHPVVLCSRASGIRAQRMAGSLLPAQGRAQRAKKELRAVCWRLPGRSV